MRSDLPAILRHPIVLGGFSVIGVLLIAAGILTMVDRGKGNDAKTVSPGVVVTPGNTPTARPGARARTVVATSVHSGPGERNPVFGTVPAGADLDITGRNSDATWFEIRYPPGSDLKGWVNADDVELFVDSMALAAVTPEELPYADIPTLPPGSLKTPIAYTPEATVSLATATPEAVADLVVDAPISFVGGALVATIVNQGAGAAAGTITVAVFDADGNLLGGAAAPVSSLPPGGRIDVNTGFTGAPGITRVIVSVNTAHTVPETDYSNNSLSVTLSGPVPTFTPPPPPPPTATPTIEPTLPPA